MQEAAAAWRSMGLVGNEENDDKKEEKRKKRTARV